MCELVLGQEHECGEAGSEQAASTSSDSSRTCDTNTSVVEQVKYCLHHWFDTTIHTLNLALKNICMSIHR